MDRSWPSPSCRKWQATATRALCILRFALNTIAMFIPEVHQGIIDKEEDKVFLIQLTKLSYEKWNNVWQ